jgi:hypothetical protein
MKKITFFLLSIFLLPYYNYAQVRVETEMLSVNLFEQFVNGSVRLKNGHIEYSTLNYNTQHQSIVFKKDNQVLVLTGLLTVDTVYMNDKKFVPIDNTFYEVAVDNVQIGLYITYTNIMTPLVATTEHSGTSRKANTDVSNTVSGVYVSRPFNATYTLKVIRHFWLKRGHSFYKANNENQLLKVFPFKAGNTIKTYIKENNIDFNKQEDIIRLVRFCNTSM